MEKYSLEDIQDTPRLMDFLRRMIIESLKLEDLDPAEIRENEPLFGEGLGLDSLDALELVVAIEKHFGVVIENEDQGKEAFVSLGALARYIQREVCQL
jgi:acyl carrier protein